MSLEESATYKRAWRIILLHRWAKANKCTDFNKIVEHCILRFVCAPVTAKAYSREVLMRMEREKE